MCLTGTFPRADVDDYIGLPKRGQPYLVDNLEALVHKYKKVADDSNY
jgi:hypothetical protein